MDHYRSELEAARQRIAALEDQLQRREEPSTPGSVDALALRDEAPLHATLLDAPDSTRPLVMFKDEMHQAADRVMAHDVYRFGRWGLLGSVVMGLVGMLPALGGSLATGLGVLCLLSVPCAAFVLDRRRKLPRTQVLCPLCGKPGIYTQRGEATIVHVHRILAADDETCDDLSALPWFSELRKLFRQAGEGKEAERQEIYRQMLVMSRRMSVCNRRCYDCSAEEKPFWIYTRPVTAGADAEMN
jgi:hypothetical protein